MFKTKQSGWTRLGGSNNTGLIFKINTNGANFAILHHFLGTPSDGSSPNNGALVVGPDSSTLYGMTYYGGSGNYGIVYKLKPRSETIFSLR